LYTDKILVIIWWNNCRRDYTQHSEKIDWTNVGTSVQLEKKGCKIWIFKKSSEADSLR